MDAGFMKRGSYHFFVTVGPDRSKARGTSSLLVSLQYAELPSHGIDAVLTSDYYELQGIVQVPDEPTAHRARCNLAELATPAA